MARKPRLEYPGATYHVYTRGDNKEAIFLSDEDYRIFLQNLYSYKEKWHFKLFSYCLMTNHLHLLIKVDTTPLSKIMHSVSSSYVKYFNRTHQKIGHLFQSRYKAVVIGTDAHLLETTRYIHLNPAVAGITDEPIKYPWSSYRSYCSNTINTTMEPPNLLDTAEILSYFAMRLSIQKRRYRVFVQEGLVLGRERAAMKREIAHFRREGPVVAPE